MAGGGLNRWLMPPAQHVHVSKNALSVPTQSLVFTQEMFSTRTAPTAERIQLPGRFFFL